MRTLLFAAASAFLLTLVGCNTFAGFGRDIERVGEKTQEVSRDASDGLRDRKRTQE